MSEEIRSVVFFWKTDTISDNDKFDQSDQNLALLKFIKS